MKRSFARIVLAALCMVAATGTVAKDAVTIIPPPPVPELIRQGGDTFADALLITSEFFTADGTTAGFTDDYDEVCPYANSTSPDVVYRFTPAYEMVVDIDLLGSEYDTKVYVYGAGMELIACNDDFYPDYTSRIENLLLVPGVKYYIVIDGYGGSFGDYHLEMGIIPPAEVECPAGSQPEGEPALADGYVDAFNGGCTNSDQGLNLLDFGWSFLCSKSGWFAGGRDHDWYRGYGIFDPYNSFEVFVVSEQAVRVAIYSGADCEALVVEDEAVLESLEEGYFHVGAYPDQEFWVEVHPAAEVPPPGFEGHEFDYIIAQSFPVGAPSVAVEARNWSSLKGLFD
jgi:hypothetical protein